MKATKRFILRPQNLIGVGLVGAYLLMALFAPLLAPSKTEGVISVMRGKAGDTSHFRPLPPEPGLPLGSVPTSTPTRHLDIFYTVVWGARSALTFAVPVGLLAAFIGVTVGAASAYIGGFGNNLIMRITDAFLAFPLIVGIVLFQQLTLLLIESSSVFQFFLVSGEVMTEGELPAVVQFMMKLDPVMIAVIFLSWMIYARVTNAVVLTLKQTEFVSAARALGASHARIIFRHLIPNAITPALVLLTKDIGGLVLLQAAMTFIGMGGKSQWGQMLVLGRRFVIGPGGSLLSYWWTFFPVTLAIVLFGVGWNLLGDAIADWLNPRSTTATL